MCMNFANGYAFAADIPVDALQYNGHLYKAYDTKYTWAEAQWYCQSLGGHLMTITTEGEQAILSKLGLKGGYNYWLGGTDDAREGTWKWITGESWGYAAWGENQPDNSQLHTGVEENYLQLCVGWGMRWNDSAIEQDSTANIGFICEWDNALDISSAAIKLSSTSYTYDGSEKRPSVTVTYGGKILSHGRDYGLTYSDNINAGTGYVTIAGKGVYKGAKVLSFTIKKRPISETSISLNKTSFIYDKKSKTPKITVKYNGKNLKSKKDYSLVFVGAKGIGKAYVYICGQGNFKGKVKKTYTIKLKTPSLMPVLSLSKGSVSYALKNKIAGATHYRFVFTPVSGGKKLVSESTSWHSLKAYNVKPGKKYKVKAQAIADYHGKTYKSDFSKEKVVKIKK